MSNTPPSSDRSIDNTPLFRAIALIRNEIAEVTPPDTRSLATAHRWIFTAELSRSRRIGEKDSLSSLYVSRVNPTSQPDVAPVSSFPNVSVSKYIPRAHVCVAPGWIDGVYIYSSSTAEGTIEMQSRDIWLVNVSCAARKYARVLLAGRKRVFFGGSLKTLRFVKRRVFFFGFSRKRFCVRWRYLWG